MRIQTRYLRGLLVALLVGAAGPAWAAGAIDLRLVEAVQKQNKQAVPSLLMQGVDPSLAQADGTTALHWAAHWDDAETADLLILFGADPNAKNDYGTTPLLLACANGNAAMVETLLTKATTNPHLAAPSGETPLMRCARTGNVETVKSLLAHKADPDAKDTEQQQTALMWAVAQKHPEAAKALIDGGADIHAKSKGGFTALLFAARVGDPASAGVLLAAGADVNEAGPKGLKPLVLASASGQEATAIFLLDKGADPNGKDDNGATALHYVAMKGITALNGVRYANYVEYLFRPSLTELAKALIAHGANVNARLDKSPALGGYQPAGGAAAGGQAAAGATPFLLAAASPDPAMMRLLVAAGADPKLGTNSGLTPVMVASGLSRGQDFTDDEKKFAADAVRITVELGGDVNAVNDDGLTAMHGAALNGADAVVEYLAQKGAKLDVRDKYQQTPLSIATGIRLPWIPYGDELGEIIQPSTRDLLLKLGATPVDAPEYFKPPTEFSEAYRLNLGQRYEGATAPVPGSAPAPAPR